MNFGCIKKLVTVSLAVSALSSLWSEQIKPVFHLGARGELVYASDGQGNRVPDFSSAGYQGGGQPLPRVDAKVTVRPSGEDDTARIQAAIDLVAKMPLDERGIRGAVELAPGDFKVSGQLLIRSSGVILRGASGGEVSTRLIAADDGRRTLIAVGSTVEFELGEERLIADEYVPVGSREIKLSSTRAIVPGDSIRIVRPGSEKWVSDLGMDTSPARTPFNWRGEAVILRWDRGVVSVEGNRVLLDGPITTALDAQYGQASVREILSDSAISQVGVENLECISEFDTSNEKDENHSWVAVSLEGVVDGWVSDVSAKNFVLSAVRVGEHCRRVTVQDCAFLEPVSEVGGYRRQSFNTYGQQTLFLRCYSEYAIDDFTVGHLSIGPNVFLDCRTLLSQGTSGSIGHWASGILFDNVHVDGGALALDNREIWNQGVGWAAANSVIYQSSAANIISRRPPTANNWAIGVWALFHGDGSWIQTSEFANPDSLYVAQLEERLGSAVGEALKKRVYVSERSAAPDLEKLLPELPQPVAVEKKPMRIVNGQLQANGLPLVGQDRGVTWWRGRLLPTRAGDFGYSITRFTPGRSGAGLTDDLEEMTDRMLERGDVSLRHHYGLWYDRRRDDHQMTRRSSGDVWPPFYEQAFSRSGIGGAWDGLSKYDLFKYNPWYFQRLETFANLAEEKGLVLVNEMFFQHNIIESGAHWVDNPWRPENTIQKTDFPEPPPFTGDTIHLAEEFYDVSHPVRRAVNRAYIRKCLDNLADDPNVIHVIGAEFTGPLHFMQFWLDTVAEWMEETGNDPVIGLSCTKDVQDAVLADPLRGKLVDVIDFQYWWYTDDAVFDPEGGVGLAPRQHERKWKGGRPSGESLARMVAEYRRRFPNKAVITPLEIKDTWAYMIAGGSLAPLPRETDEAILKTFAISRPVDSGLAGVWVLKSPKGDFLVRRSSETDFDTELLDPKSEYEFLAIDPRTGQTDPADRFRSNDKDFQSRLSRARLFWLRPL